MLINFNIPAAQRGNCSKLRSDPFHFFLASLLLSTFIAPLSEIGRDAANDKIQWEKDKNKLFDSFLIYS